jgi:hypothetical protein
MLRLIIALVLILHGIGHTMGFFASWTSVPMGFRDQPWLLSSDITIASPVGRAFGLLWLVAMIGFVGAGLGLIFNNEWWKPLTIASSVISLIVIVPWWNTVATGAQLGASLVDIIAIVVLSLPIGDSLIESLR